MLVKYQLALQRCMHNKSEQKTNVMQDKHSILEKKVTEAKFKIYLSCSDILPLSSKK